MSSYDNSKEEILIKAITCIKYGPPEVLQLKEVEKPIPKNNEVLVKIHATAVTASDCVIRGFNMPGNPSFPKKQIMELMMRIFLGFSKPRNPIIGLVFSGVVESVGNDVEIFNKGDQVYGFTGNSRGTYAEYKCVCAKEIEQGELVLKPKNISHKEAAAIVYGGALAMHFMQDGDIQDGKKVLIYGASGAIGTTAVQLAKQLGAEVTAVCSSTNRELVKSLGADKVIDYTKEDSLNQLELYDFILDAVGKNKSSKLKSQCETALSNSGKYVSVDDGFLKIHPQYLIKLNELIEAGHVKAVIDRNYPLEEIVEAHKYVDQGHKKGNVVITV
ncbi:NAD(P)-dependent alcohol dehydrogenase [Cytobacillus sp. IB215665]|uniref:NAD(P)-dependent alcohol dehydrogenase n=1 Tax=Cytobacillus sp. IB215665 TaxID=3097357 RepID=UPI002A161BC7|nr:NAD(P)-dependent alcohol dehydrogenase [Cytobacillus sp. IB215665]MDX8366037.1 NAD(P)-dependent alcohol dehydrogenase [Cytobacillus sp. IB215665]